MNILAIDPGTTESAYYGHGPGDEWKLAMFDKVPNEFILNLARTIQGMTVMVVEEIRSYGMGVGKTTFDTVRLTGRLEEIAHHRNIPFVLVGRLDIKLHWCKSPKATDSNIMHALLDHYGPKGTKKNPGPTYGISGTDIWSALAIHGYYEAMQQV